MRGLTVLLTIVAVLSSILFAARLASLTDTHRELLAVAAAVATAMLSAFSLPAKADRMRWAWRELNSACIGYEEGVVHDDGAAMQSLLDSYRRAETIIGNLEITTTAPPVDGDAHPTT